MSPTRTCSRPWVGRRMAPWTPGGRPVGRSRRAIPATIRTAGLDYDLIDDDALAVTAPGDYPVVIVPRATSVPKATAEWLDRVRSAGGTVLSVDSSVQLADAVEVTTQELSAVLAASVAPDLEITPPTPEIGVVHRRSADAEIYLLANTGRTSHTFEIATA